jgi:hypothetical protein
MTKRIWKQGKKPPISEKFILNHGMEFLTRQQIGLIQVPPATESYKPVSHSDLVENFLAISQGIIKDWILVSERYISGRQGQQLFGILSFKKDNPEFGIAIAFRNSYDRSMSVGICIGASIFSCNNLALPGEMIVMKKHSKEVLETIGDSILTALYKNQHDYETVMADAERLKKISISDSGAFQLMGLLYGNDIVSPRQLTAIRGEWAKPSRSEVQDKNMWSFLNMTLESLKTSPPIAIMEQHIRAYRFLTTYKAS